MYLSFSRAGTEGSSLMASTRSLKARMLWSRSRKLSLWWGVGAVDVMGWREPEQQVLVSLFNCHMTFM